MSAPFTVYHRRVPPQRAGGHSRLFTRYSARNFKRRSALGSQIVEFGAALFLLFAFVFLPLLDLAIVPVRWMMAQELINNYIRSLAMCETHTQALRAMEADPSLRDRLLQIGGVQVRSTSLYLTITRISVTNETKFIEVRNPGTIPAAWLPDGRFAPCQYSLVLDVKASIAPAVLLNWDTLSIPGLTKPIPISIVVLHDWGNLGKDPSSERYFMNE